jgi:hypothetical protein
MPAGSSHLERQSSDRLTSHIGEIGRSALVIVDAKRSGCLSPVSGTR